MKTLDNKLTEHIINGDFETYTKLLQSSKIDDNFFERMFKENNIKEIDFWIDKIYNGCFKRLTSSNYKSNTLFLEEFDTNINILYLLDIMKKVHMETKNTSLQIRIDILSEATKSNQNNDHDKLSLKKNITGVLNHDIEKIPKMVEFTDIYSQKYPEYKDSFFAILTSVSIALYENKTPTDIEEIIHKNIYDDKIIFKENSASYTDEEIEDWNTKIGTFIDELRFLLQIYENDNEGYVILTFKN